MLLFFSMSVSQPLLSQISLTKRETLEAITMSQALGIPEGRSHMVTATTTSMVGDQNQPLDKLLVNKRFLHSFMAFADRCAPQFPLVATKPSGHVYNMLVLHLIVVVWLARVCISLKRHMN